MAIETQHARKYRLTVSCPDRVGIVAAVTQFFASHNGWISEAHQFADTENCQFFMRYEVLADSLPFELDELKAKFAPLGDEFGMHWQITDSAERKRVVLMVSKEAHALSDLLYRWRSGEMNIDIPCVISNHDVLRSYVEWHGIPFHYVPVPKDDKAGAFAKIEEIIDRHDADTVVSGIG